MKYNLYSVRDDLTGFLNVSVDTNDDTAKRGFAQAVRDRNSMMYANPADFRLYCVGEWNSETGSIVPCEPRLVCQAIEFVKEVSNV